jgi:hypothetical protein
MRDARVISSGVNSLKSLSAEHTDVAPRLQRLQVTSHSGQLSQPHQADPLALTLIASAMSPDLPSPLTDVLRPTCARQNTSNARSKIDQLIVTMDEERAAV